MGDDLGLTKGDDSPWAGNVPAAAPAEFQWTKSPAERPAERSVEHAVQGYGNVDERPRLRSSEHSASPAPAPSTSRTKMFVAIAVFGVLALGAASLIAGRDDSRSATSTETTAPSVSETDAQPATDGQLEPVETEPAPTTTEGVSLQPRPAPDDLFPETDPATEGADPTWTTAVFDPPDGLRNADVPTTIVLVTRDGVLRELDMSTGAVSELQIGSTLGQNQVLVGRSSTLVSGGRGPFGAGTAVLYRADESPITVGGESGDANYVARPNSDVFTGFLFGTGPGDFREFVVQPNGVIDQTAASLETSRPPWLRRYAPNGDELFSDGGSVYRESSDGAVTLLTGGELVATSSHHVLVRECDEAYTCASTVIAGGTGERQLAQIGPEYVRAFVADAAQISPDGSKLWFTRFDDQATEYIMDLTTGAAIEIGEGSGFGEGPNTGTYVWTADSSGVIRPTVESLDFVDAVSGERTEFATEFASPVAFGVRLDLNGVTSATFEPTDTGIQIAGYGNGDVYRIDIDTGEIVGVSADPIGSGAPVFVMSDQNGISVVAYDNVDGIRVEGDVATPITDGPFGGLMVAGPRPDTLWVPGARSSGGSGSEYELYDALGQPLGGTIRLPKGAAAASGSDGAGGIVSRPELGGAYVIDQGEVVRITTGELLALGPTTAIAEECNESYLCGVVVIDRLSGERSSFDDLVLASVIAPPPQSAFLSGHTVAPSGDAALLYNVVSGEYVFVDLATGNTVTTPSPDAESIVVWSNDGRAAVYLANGQLQLYERSTTSVRPLSQFPRLRSFAALSSVVPAGLVKGPSPIPF